MASSVEKDNQTREPTANNALAASGAWRLLYTNLENLGRRRVRLAIATSRKPGFVKPGDFVQIVEPSTHQSTNIVHFSVLTESTERLLSQQTTRTIVRQEFKSRRFQRLWSCSHLNACLSRTETSCLIFLTHPTGFLEIT